jgi:hypothetical protein
VPAIRESEAHLIAETEAGLTWVSGRLRWRILFGPALMAVIGVACGGVADALARHGNPGTQPLWWVGVLTIFVPAAATLLFVKVSRNEAVFTLLLVGLALFAYKLLYAPGMLWGFDELLHYRTIEDILATHRLFSPNELLPVSPYYPGMEAATAVIVQLTGLNIVQSGLVLIGVARALTVVSVFLLLERIAMPSRFAAPATLLYMACPSFLYFDSMFSYESLALSLSLVCVFVLRAAQLDHGTRRQPLNAVGAILVLAVAVTHHVTSFLLTAALVAWALIELINAIRVRKRASQAVRNDTLARRRHVYLIDLPGSGWVPALSVTAVLVWLLNIAEVAISYLTPQLMSGFNEVLRMIRFEGASRQLFQSTAGHSSPLLERAVGIGSVLILLVSIPLGIKYLWERRHSSVLSHSLAIGSLAYPAILALRFTRSGWDIGSRASAFVYVLLAFTVAAGIEPLIARRIRNSRLGATAVVLATAIIFAGGIVAGTSPVTRQPAPYSPGTAEVPYDVQSLAVANWAANTLGPGHRFAADSAQGTLIASVGRQRLVTSADGVFVSDLFLSPGFGNNSLSVIRKGRIDYVLVDRRITGAQPLKGFIYEPWEQQTWNYGSSVTSATVNKFDFVRDASKQFDSGDIEFFELHRLRQ